MTSDLFKKIVRLIGEVSHQTGIRGGIDIQRAALIAADVKHFPFACWFVAVGSNIRKHQKARSSLIGESDLCSRC